MGFSPLSLCKTVPLEVKQWKGDACKNYFYTYTAAKPEKAKTL